MQKEIHIQQITRLSGLKNEPAPVASIISCTYLEGREPKPTMTLEEFTQCCRTLTLGLIQDNVELVTEITNGWAFILLDPNSMAFVQIKLTIGK